MNRAGGGGRENGKDSLKQIIDRTVYLHMYVGWIVAGSHLDKYTSMNQLCSDTHDYSHDYLSIH